MPVTRVTINALGTAAAGSFSMFNSNGVETVEIIAAETVTTGAQIQLRNAAGNATIELDSEFVNLGTNHSRITTEELLARNRVFLGSAAFALANNSTLNPDHTYVRVIGNGGAVTVSATTAIANGEMPGQLLIIEGLSDVNTVTIPAGANTSFSANRVLGADDVLTLIWNGNNWLQTSFANN
jgi:hypothetical protein